VIRDPFLVVLGKQGAGKGTQAVRISRHYAIPHIATGDMLRAAIKAQVPLGLEAKKAIDAGELVPDEVVLRLLDERLMRDGAKERGFVLDGFPRTLSQARLLDDLIQPSKISIVIDISVPTAIVLKRLAARRVCSDCQAVYSLTSPPKINWTCDICGGEVVQRDDDTEAAILRRLALYEDETAPLIEHYKERDLLVTVSGVGTTEAVTARIIRAIDNKLA
jgi:adenylate kinase